MSTKKFPIIPISLTFLLLLLSTLSVLNIDCSELVIESSKQTATGENSELSPSFDCPLNKNDYIEEQQLQDERAEKIKAPLLNSTPTPSQSNEVDILKTNELDSVDVVESSQDEDEIGDDQWKWKYIDEHVPGFKQEIYDDSLDERYSNLIYTINSARMMNIDTFTFNMGNKELNEKFKRLAASPRVNNELCSKYLAQMISIAEELSEISQSQRTNNSSMKLEEKHIKMARILDSFGSYEAGILSGKNMFLGSQPQCLSTQMILNQEENSDQTTTINSRYCFARLRNDRRQNPALSSKKAKSLREPDNVVITAICIPEACHTISYEENKHLFEKLVNSQFKLPKLMFIDENLELDDIYCSVDPDSEQAKLPIEGKILLAFLSCLTLAVAFATYKCETTDKDEQQSLAWQILKSLNLRQTWDEFTCIKEQRTQQGRVDLDALNPTKVLGMAFVVIGHMWMLMVSTTMDLPRSYKENESDPLVFLALSGTTVVDSFFVITGLLLTYIVLSKQKESKNNTLIGEIYQFFKQTIQIIGSRYLRLLPLYLMVYCFKKAILLNLNNGPLADNGFNKETAYGGCRLESWTTPFTFVAPYLNLSIACFPQSWSIGADMFFIAVLAPIIIIMTKRPKLAGIISILICLASSTAMYNDFVNMDPSLRRELVDFRYHGFSLLFKHGSQLYSAPHYRIFSAVIGSLAGYVLYHYNKSDQDWPNWLKTSATWFAFVSCSALLMAFSMIPIFKRHYLDAYPIHRDVFDFLMTSSRLIWATSSAILFLRMTTDWKDNFWIRNGRGKLWRCLVNLNYAILLIHLDIQIYLWSIRSTLDYLSHTRILVEAFGVYFICCLIATVIYNIIESPIHKLVKLLLEGRKSSPPSQKLVNGNKREVINNKVTFDPNTKEKLQ